MQKELKEELLKLLEEKIEVYTKEAVEQNSIKKICNFEDGVDEFLVLDNEIKENIYIKMNLSTEEIKYINQCLDILRNKDNFKGEIAASFIQKSRMHIENFINKIKLKYTKYLGQIEADEKFLDKMKNMKEELTNNSFLNLETLEEYDEILSVLKLTEEEKLEIIKYILINKTNYISSHNRVVEEEKIEKIEDKIETAISNLEAEELIIPDIQEEIEELEPEELVTEPVISSSINVEVLENFSEEKTNKEEIEKPLFSVEEKERIIEQLQTYLVEEESILIQAFTVICDEIISQLNLVKFDNLNLNSHIDYYDSILNESDKVDKESIEEILRQAYNTGKYTFFKDEKEFNKFLLLYIIKTIKSLEQVFELYDTSSLDDEIVFKQMLLDTLNKTINLNDFKNKFNVENHGKGSSNPEFTPIVPLTKDDVNILIYAPVLGISNFERSYDDLDKNVKHDVKKLLENAKHTKKLREDRYFESSRTLRYDIQNKISVIFRKVKKDYLLLDIMPTSIFEKSKLQSYVDKYDTKEVEEFAYKLLTDEDFYNTIFANSETIIKDVLTKEGMGEI